MVLRHLNETFSGARGRLFAGALAVPLAMGAWFSAAQPASAQDTSPTAAGHVWESELRELDIAASAAREYAQDNYGVGILLHVGRDMSQREGVSTEEAIAHVSNYLINEFAKRGIEARVYARSNSDTIASGVNYYIDDIIHGAHNGTENKNLREALAAIPDVIAHLKTAKQIAGLEADEPVKQPGG